MPARNFHILLVLVVVCMACYIQAERLKYAGKIGSAISLIEDNFVREIDPDDLYIAAMDGIVSKLDRFSEFIPPTEYEDFQSVIEQQFGGLGVVIEGPPAAKQLTVVTPIPGTPAFNAGMQPGDVIVQIGERSTEGLIATEATKLMRGPVGDRITLKVKRMGVPRLLTMEIARADIRVDSVYGDHIAGDSMWDYFLPEDDRIAYIRITLFGERTRQEFEEALQKVRPSAQALIIDLRSNPGGILPTAVALCDALIDQGTIVTTRGRRRDFEMEFRADAEMQLDRDIPIVVLVNGNSASASEIMAGCLQDAGRAKIAGERSYGKGTVQQVFPLDNDTTALKFTTAKFYRPSGKNIHRDDEMTKTDEWGVTPDPGLELPISGLQELYLNRRWQQSGDPRLTIAAEKPPSPAFAGDPQLRVAVEYLQKELDAGNAQ